MEVLQLRGVHEQGEFVVLLFVGLRVMLTGLGRYIGVRTLIPERLRWLESGSRDRITYGSW